ncbi:MAG: bacteriohopanetetrol glucosamine biosynthesis glycosyltransferase HpnI [Xenococcaceae cyanobacterium MO_234.B1]|nr:bacteriohopanetetrol glucosamine biosynthesis glycosyltransferase HpnI [Xenococcaceae cyanobacterium MO_234.B1]
MPSPADIFSIICLVPVISGSVYSILSVWTIIRFFTSSRSDLKASDGFTPPVTVLKPVKGLEKDLKSNLRTIGIQDYPKYQVVYSVQDTKDPALPILQEIQKELGSERISVVISTVQAGANGKVNNLLGAIEEARHDIIIISDSDTHLRPDYLESLVAPLSNPDVGCVCTLFKLTRAERWFEKMELLTINEDFIPSVIFAQVTGASNACLGPSIAIRKSTLQELGGLESLADYLVEDYELGRRVWTSGKKMVILPYVIDAVVDLEDWRQWWNHQVYWEQNTYLARPGAFIATILIRAVPFALLFAMVRVGDPLGLSVLVCAIAVRLLTAGITSLGLRDAEGLRSLYLLPLRDIVGLIFWLLAFTQRTVVWRGVEFKLTSHGKMVPLGSVTSKQ